MAIGVRHFSLKKRFGILALGTSLACHETIKRETSPFSLEVIPMNRLLLILLCLLWGMPSLAAEPQVPTAASLRVLSFNIWGLPAPIGRDLLPRLERIAEAIQDYDLVLIQEAFDQSTARLPEMSGFPYAYHHQNLDLWRQASGLMILSRFPIVDTDFMPFPGLAPPDLLANKGVLFARLQHPDLGYLDVYNTHYQSRQQPDAAEVRIRSNNTTLKHLLLKHQQYFPTIIGGDFNAVPGRPEHQDLLQRLPLIDTYTAAPKTPEIQTIAHSWPSDYYASRRKNRIDYVFLLENALWDYAVQQARMVFDTPWRDYLLSDHLGVAATIRIQTQGQAEPLPTPFQVKATPERYCVLPACASGG